MYIFSNPPVTVLLSKVKMGSKVAPINDVYGCMGEEALPWERATKTKQANKLVQSEARTLGSGGVGSLCDASLATWESCLWVQSGTSLMASSAHAGGNNAANPTPEISAL